MKKRQLQRAKASGKGKGGKEAFPITNKAAETANYAAKHQAFIDCIGNFIFFSTESGDAWMLDHRKNYALRLAQRGTISNYGLRESAHRFQVEWKERYRLENDLFIASRKGEETTYEGYPVDAINGLVKLMEKKS